MWGGGSCKLAKRGAGPGCERTRTPHVPPGAPVPLPQPCRCVAQHTTACGARRSRRCTYSGFGRQKDTAAAEVPQRRQTLRVLLGMGAPVVRGAWLLPPLNPRPVCDAAPLSSRPVHLLPPFLRPPQVQ